MSKYPIIALSMLMLLLRSTAEAQPVSNSFRPDPDQALLNGLVLPGSGQVYNREAWKAPLVWGLFVVLGAYADEQHRQYVYATRSLEYINDSNPETVNPIFGRSASNLEQQSERFRRERDYAFILIGVTYILQALEAHVSAHLFDFDDDDVLSYRSKLSYAPTPVGTIFSWSLSLPLKS